MGGGDNDALEQAARLARSLADDATLRSLVANVLPVAGLLAQSAVTLDEATYRSLGALASHAASDLDAALVSVDRFAAPDRLTAVSPPERTRLVATLGLYGVRRAIDAIRAGRVASAHALSQELTRASGLDGLRSVIFRQFAGRAPVVKAARALEVLEAALDGGQVRPDPTLLEDLERVRVNAHAIVELRALNEALCSPSLAMDRAKRADVARVLGSEGLDARTRLGLAATAPETEVADRLREESRRWQTTATSSLSLPDEQRLARIAVRSLTAFLAAETPSGS